ncbi:MAG: transposase [Bacteroidaceae bacterium]|nr:transposase [Bacteroidaceae bacterium]
MENERKEFVQRALNKEKTKAALCREYGISRPTGDKWIRRYLNGDTMADKSRRPFHTPNKISTHAEQIIVEARQKEPAIGAVKTRRILMNEGWDDAPSISTFNAVFKRNGLITKESSEAAQPHIRFQKEQPNEMWQMDFKGDFLLQNKVRCYPLSIIDDCSRFCLCGDAKANQQLFSVQESLIRVFNEYGLPFSILCDNGVPWGSSQSTSITKFEAWMMELGILTMHIRALHPQTQGKVERFNGSYKRERLKFYTPKDMDDAQRCREEYREFYNTVRPHCALDYDVPIQRYQPSNRKYREKIENWDYEGDAILRNVKSSGYLTFNSHGFFLSEGLGDKQVALIPTEQDGIFNVVFRQFRVAKLNLHTNTIVSRRVYLLHNDPRQKCK